MNTGFSRILFDYDGTLIIHDKVNEGRQIAKMLGLDVEQTKEFEKRLKLYFEKHFVIRGRKITYHAYFENLERNIRIYEDFGILPAQLYDAICENSKISTALVPNAKETLEYLCKKGYQLCLFTNGFYDGQVENMKYKGIYEYFEKIYAWDDFYAKPDERAYYRALAKTDPKRNVMIGDNLEADIVPAKKLGIYTIGINLGSQDLRENRPDKIITNLSELRQIL